MKLMSLDQVGSAQCGLVTVEQVDSLFTLNQRKYLVESGQLIGVRRGLYRMPGAPQTWQQQLLAVLLLGGDKYVISHRAAARWHGLGNVWQDEILEFSIEQSQRYKTSGLIVHKAPLPAQHIVRNGLFRLTSIARTFADLVAVAPLEKISVGLDFALSRNLVKMDMIEQCVGEVRRPGKPKISLIDSLIAERRAKPAPSWLARRTLEWIRSAGLPAPVPEFPVPTDICTWHVDLAYPELDLGIECNGYTDHGHRTAFDEDARRLSSIAATGMRIMPVTTKTQKHVFIRELIAAHQRSRRRSA